MILALAEAQSWGALSVDRLLQYMLFINWILLCFVALIERFQQKFQHLSFAQALCVGFILLQAILLLTTVALNGLIYFGQNFHFHH